MDRRRFLKASTVGTIGMTGLAGCLDGDNADEDEGEEESLGDTVEFAMSPTEPQEEMEAQYGPMADYLGGELDAEVNLNYAAAYSAVISGLGANSVQIGEMGPFAAALGIRSEEIEVILQRHAFGSWEYPSVIVTREDTDIDTLEDLEGKTIAFADRLSASGSLYPLYMLQERAGLDIGELPEDEGGADFDATFSGHAAAIEALEAGTADAAGVGMFIAVVDGDEEREEYQEGIELVDKIEGIPRAPIAVSPRLTDEAQEDIQQAFIDAPDEAYEGTGEDDLWFDDVREADGSVYDEVVDVANALDIDIELLDEDA